MGDRLNQLLARVAPRSGLPKGAARLLREDSGLADPVPAGTPLGASRPACAPAEQAPGPSTSEVSIVDLSANALAMTTTTNVNFGAWITTRGFILNDAMTNFSRPTDGGCPPECPCRQQTRADGYGTGDCDGCERNCGSRRRIGWCGGDRGLRSPSRVGALIGTRARGSAR
jgi:hypothetical protein